MTSGHVLLPEGGLAAARCSYVVGAPFEQAPDMVQHICVLLLAGRQSRVANSAASEWFGDTTQQLERHARGRRVLPCHNHDII